MQLNPSQQYSIVRQLDNINDPATYYVRAIVRFSNTGKIWKTVDLSLVSDQRYVGSFVTPSDGSMGTQIDITTYVYEDSGYTTLSSVYSTVNVEHVVQTMFNQYLGFGGGGDGIKREDIVAILRQELKGIPMPEPLQMDEFAGKFSNKLEPHLNVFHDSIIQLHNKNESLVEMLKESDVKNNKKIEVLIENIEKNYEKKFKDLEGLVEKHNTNNKKEINEFVKTIKDLSEKLLEDGYLMDVNKRIDYFQNLFKESFEKITKHNEKVRNKNIEKIITKIKNELQSDLEPEIWRNEEEDLLKAIKLLS